MSCTVELVGLSVLVWPGAGISKGCPHSYLCRPVLVSSSAGCTARNCRLLAFSADISDTLESLSSRRRRSIPFRGEGGRWASRRAGRRGVRPCCPERTLGSCLGPLSEFLLGGRTLWPAYIGHRIGRSSLALTNNARFVNSDHFQ